MIPLSTPRLVLREFSPGDLEAVQAYASDIEICRHMVWGPNTEADTRAFLEKAARERTESPRLHHELAIVLCDGDRLVGGARLSIRNRDRAEADLGYVVNRSFWRRGIATEAARALLRFGFDALRLHRLWATCDVDNPASSRVLEKIGMTREGRLREHQLIRGAWRDSFLYAILDREWRGLAGPPGPEAPTERAR